MMNRVSIEDFARMFYAEKGCLEGSRADLFDFAHKAGVMIPFIMNSKTAQKTPKGTIYKIPVPDGFSPQVEAFLNDIAASDEEVDSFSEPQGEVADLSPVASVENTNPSGKRPRGRPRKNAAVAEISDKAVPSIFAQAPVIRNNSGPNLVIGNSAAASESFVPRKDANFIPWGIHSEIEQIIRSGIFFPIYNTGLSGCGKTEGILQACARVGRECIRVNITAETDEDDLVGGFRLIAGDTVWVDGPVVEAAQRGAILLLDEIDLATPKIMSLQPVLEGKPFFIKKIGKYIVPAPGFNVFATANTKGKGSATGHFVGTNFLNEAFLDRFAITLEHSYPTPAVEKRILSKFAAALFGTSTSDKENKEIAELVTFIDCLVDWAAGIRKNFDSGVGEEVITTRRLLDILKSYRIFGKIGKSVKYGIARFDAETQVSFATYYAKLDPRVDNSLRDLTTKEVEAAATPRPAQRNNNISF